MKREGLLRQFAMDPLVCDKICVAKPVGWGQGWEPDSEGGGKPMGRRNNRGTIIEPTNDLAPNM